MVNLSCAVVKVLERAEGAKESSGSEGARRKRRRKSERGQKRDKRASEAQESRTISGDYSKRDPPVPIPNTEVKPLSADGTWLATARESKTSPDSKRELERQRCFSNNLYSSVAQWQSTRLLTELL